MSNGNASGDSLIWAVEQGDLPRIKELLGGGADANYEDTKGITPLRAAGEQDQSEILTKIVDALLGNGADMNRENQNKTTALMHAVLFNYIELMKLLLNNGANVNHENEEGMTALILAVTENRRSEVVKILLNNGADGGDTLIWAARNNEHEAADVLLMVNVNYKNQYGNTALIAAAADGYSKVVKLLLDNDADVNYENKKDGNTALIAAADANHIEVARVLLEHEKNPADVNYKNTKDKTALMVVEDRKGYEEMEEILTKPRPTE